MWTGHQLHQMQRRVFLKAGALPAVGLSLPALLYARAQANDSATTTATAKACILLYMTGGPAQQETFDMKPKGPDAARGEFRPIATNVPGIDICELMPNLARRVHHLAILRSVYHDQTFHGAGCHYNLTGFPHAPREPTPEFYLDRRDAPGIGSILMKLRGSHRSLPAAVQLPYWIQQGAAGRFAGQTAGFLGANYDPLPMFYEEKESLPGTLPADYRLPEEISANRLSDRARLLSTLDGEFEAGERLLRHFTQFHYQAFEILNSSGAWRAFGIDDETPETIDRYGQSKFGRSCLVARRLIEAGVSLVNVCWPGHENHFDTHSDHFPSMRNSLLPPSDKAFAALLQDLDERGMLAETLVVWTAEFGRTPSLNGNNLPGRDHWPYVYSTVLAGGGIRGGQVYGKSDAIAAYPQENPVHVRDFVSTIYHALGYDRDAKVLESNGTPHFFVPGEPVRKLF